jgi:hypothetical protein
VTGAGDLAVWAGDGEVVIPPVTIFQAPSALGHGPGGYFFEGEGADIGESVGGGKDYDFLALFTGGFSDIFLVGAAEGLLLSADGVFDIVEVGADVSDVRTAFFFQFEGFVGEFLDLLLKGSSRLLEVRPFSVGFLDSAADGICVLDDVVPVPGARPVWFSAADAASVDVEVGKEGGDVVDRVQAAGRLLALLGGEGVSNGPIGRMGPAVGVRIQVQLGSGRWGDGSGGGGEIGSGGGDGGGDGSCIGGGVHGIGEGSELAVLVGAVE